MPLSGIEQFFNLSTADLLIILFVLLVNRFESSILGSLNFYSKFIAITTELYVIDKKYRFSAKT